MIEWFETGRVELYDLSADLGETRNLAESQPGKRRELHAALRQWREKIGAPVPTTPNPKYNPVAADKAKRKKKGRAGGKKKARPPAATP